MFEFFFKYPLSVLRKGTFVFASGWPAWLLVLLIVAAGAGLYWHARRHRAKHSTTRMWALWAMQSAMAALALFILWQPGLSIQSLKSQQNVIAVLVDTSRSMAFDDGGEKNRLTQAAELLNSGVLEQLREKFRVRLYSFAGSLDRVPSLDALPQPGNATRVGDAVANVLDESGALPMGAVLVLSDGSDNTGSFDRALMADIRKRNVPVHTVGIGAEALPADFELRDATIPAKALPNTRVAAQITVSHSGASDTETRISVRDGSEVLASKKITLKRGEPIHLAEIDFNAGDPGIRNLTFSVDKGPEETVTGNNALGRVLEVPRARKKILYIEGEPRWEYKFIRRAMHKDPSVQLVSLLRTTPNKFYRQGVDTPDELEDGFPETEAELFAYDALVIGTMEAAWFSPKQQDMIREFVNRRGGSLLLLGGRRGLADGAWDVSKVADVLPVRITQQNGETFFRGRAKVTLTRHGRNSLVCRLDDEPAKNEELWESIPMLADYQLVGELKPAAVSLLAHQPLYENARLDSPYPLLARQNYGRGKAYVFATGGSWRWKMQLPHDDPRHHTFWQQLLRSLVAHTPGTVLLSTGRTLYADNPDVHIRAEIRTKAYQPANNPAVTAIVSPETGDPVAVELQPSASEPGVFEADMIAAATGAYRVEVTALAGDETIGSETAHFRREDGLAEDFHPAQNRAVLETLAEQTGGTYWPVADAAGIAEDIRFSEAGITSLETLDLWDMPILFLLLLGLKAGEWLRRRQWGTI